MKSKKLAIVKYYQDKITRLQQDNNNLQKYFNNCFAENKKLQQQNRKLQEENQQQKEQIDRLLEYTELSKEDIKIACERDKGLAKVYGAFNSFNKLGLF